jgi:hypothetical protein
LSRLARDYQVLDVSLASIGKSFGAVGLASLGARENLIDLFGGLDNLTDLTGQFAQAFLTEAERMAPVQAAVVKAMADLGLAGIATKDQFKQTVLGLDLTTEAGQSMYAQLLTIAPAFAKVQDYLASLNGTVEDTAKTAQQLADIAKERRSLEIQLLDAQGRAAEATAARRADAIAAADESNRALLASVYAAQDAAEAQKALADAEAEAARQAEAIAKERRSLEIRLMEAEGRAADATAARRADELAATDASNRAMLEAVYAAEDLAEANKALADAQAAAAQAADEAAQQAAQAAEEAAQKAAQVAQERHDLEIRLMEAEGRSVDVLAARRADELAAADASNRALLEAIYAAEDAKAAQDALAAAQEAAAKAAEDAAQAAAQAAQHAADVAKERRGLEIALMEATGDATGALAARRADELAALDESNRALQQQIYAAQDAAEAQKALADAQAEAARAAQELAAKRTDLEIALLRATGDEIGAVARERERELAALDPSLRDLQQQVFAAQDAQAAAEAARQAQEDAARAQQEAADAAAQAAADAARQMEEIAQKRASLEIDLMKAMGDEAGALAASRAAELEAMDASLRSLQRRVNATEDLKAAYDRESGALQDTIGKFGDFGKTLREFRQSLAGGSAADSYRAAQARFVDTAAASRMGDAGALGSLQSVSQAFLEASKANAGSDFAYRRDVARVANAVDRGIIASDDAVDYARAQLTALDKSVDGLLVLNQSVLSVHDAIMALANAGGAYLAVPNSAYVSSAASAPVDTSGIEQRLDRMTGQQEAQAAQIARNTATVATLLTQTIRGGALIVATDDDEPLKTEIVA